MGLDAAQWTVSFIAAITLFIGYIISLFILASFIRFHWKQFTPKTQLGPFFLVWMANIWAFTSGSHFVANLVNGGILPGWCQFNGFASTFTAGGAVFGHTLLAFERYFLVIKGKPLSWTFIIVCFCLLYSYMGILLVIQFTTTEGFVPMEGNIWCFYNWTSMRLGDRIAGSMVLAFCFGSSQWISQAYMSVYKKTRQVVTEIGTKQSTKQSHTNRLSDVERRVFYRCLILVVCFTLFYTPITVSYLYRMISGQLIPIKADFVLMSWVELDCIATPLLVFHMNPDMRRATLAYLPSCITERIIRWLHYETSGTTQASSSIQPSIITQNSA